MKTNKLINEITKGIWLMNIHQLDAYLPIVKNVLKGKMVFPEGKADPVSFMYAGNTEEPTPLKADDSDTAQQIALINMIGPIMKYGDMCTYGADEISAALHHANNDDKVKGIVMYIDGPGGSTSAISPFETFAEEKKKPLVVLADSCYSLHYWTACVVADHIMADNNISSGFGSVGVLASFMDARGYYEKKGAKVHEIYSDHSEHKNEAFRLALEGKYDKIKQSDLNPIALKFQKAVRAARPNLKEEKGVLSGATFYADEALRLGMIDSIGNLKLAIQLVNALAEFK